MKLVIVLVGLLLTGNVSATVTKIYHCDMSQVRNGVTTFSEPGGVTVTDFGQRFYMVHHDVTLESYTLKNGSETHEGMQFARNSSGYFIKVLSTGKVTIAYNCRDLFDETINAARKSSIR